VLAATTKDVYAVSTMVAFKLITRKEFEGHCFLADATRGDEVEHDERGKDCVAAWHTQACIGPPCLCTSFSGLTNGGLTSLLRHDGQAIAQVFGWGWLALGC